MLEVTASRSLLLFFYPGRFFYVEFVDYYEDVAQQAYAILRQFEKQSSQLNLKVGGFRKGVGSSQRVQFSESSAWWHGFTTKILSRKYEK